MLKWEVPGGGHLARNQLSRAVHYDQRRILGPQGASRLMHKAGTQARDARRNHLLVSKLLPIPLIMVGLVLSQTSLLPPDFEIKTTNMIKAMEIRFIGKIAFELSAVTNSGTGKARVGDRLPE